MITVYLLLFNFFFFSTCTLDYLRGSRSSMLNFAIGSNLVACILHLILLHGKL